MKTRILICCLSIFLIMLQLSAQAQRTFVFINQMNEDIWVGAQGNPLPANGGFALPRGSQRTITVPVGTSAIRFWGRTGCNFDANGNGTCITGDCARGLYCNGAGGIPPATLAEFTLDAANAGNQDFYDISLVDGYNLPMRIIPVPGTFISPNPGNKYSCGVAGCTSDLNLTCPADLRVLSGGRTVACMSACMRYNTNQYCCTGPNNTPQTCPPTNYSQAFKAACPDAYSYAYDDESSTYVCKNATYQIIFGTGGTQPPVTGVATMYKDCNYGGYAVGLPAGDYTLSALQSRGILNDDISSLRINSGYEVQMYEHDNYAGASITATADNPCLVQTSGNWNDRVSSLRVRPNGTSSVTIQAENYSAMLGVQTEGTTDAGGGTNVGWIDAGDWMAYNAVNFPTSGTYRVEYRVASVSGGTLSLDLNAGTIQLGALGIPVTGGWQNWTTISHTVNVNAGTYNVGIFAQTGGWNINWFRITKVSGARQDDNTDVQNADASTALRLRPNPAEHELTIESDYNFYGSKIKIINAFGEEVYSGEYTLTVNIFALKAGMYTLMVVTPEDKWYTTKFVKR